MSFKCFTPAGSIRVRPAGLASEGVAVHGSHVRVSGHGNVTLVGGSHSVLRVDQSQSVVVRGGGRVTINGQEYGGGFSWWNPCSWFNKSAGPHSAAQHIHLYDHSRINGNITFDSGRGKVHLHGGSTITGRVIGGEIIQE